ncbi:hypothetical protein SASPL_156594 [Salvia splendens]|uniref:Heat shock 70kDa protein 1/8 n=1 Tax=Salvia splendens TaxID=180675 RepID=A0A8X8VWK7_SALSN|nr:hypothetical protein SASPL_156594 [Salvia splendens]
MASSAAQIHALGAAAHFTASNSTKNNPNRTVFLGAKLNTTSIPSGLKLRSKHRSARRGSTFRVVAEKVVGIDLGTTNSAVAAMEGGKPTIVTNAEGQRTTPSVVAYTKNSDRLVGQIAKRQAVVNPENTFFSVKRFIGRKMSEVDDESKQVSYNVVRDENGNVKLDCPAIGKQFAAEEISAQVLRKLVDDASKFLNDKVGDGVFEVLSTSGDTHLGGDDFDKRIVDWLAASFKNDEGIDLLKDKQALQRLTETAEKAKMELSSLTQTNIRHVHIFSNTFCYFLNMYMLIYFIVFASLPFITATADGPKHIETTLTRLKFEELCSDLLDRLKTPVQNSLRDAKLSFSDLDEVILVGGSTRIPAVQELVKKLTSKDPNVTVNPDEVVALGAAVQVERMVSEAEKFSKEDKEKRDAIDTKNQADSVVYQTEKQLKELGDKIPAPVKEKVEAKLGELKDAISGGSTQTMKDAMTALNQEVMQIGQSLYNQPGAGPTPGAGATPSESSDKGPDGDVIDADFTDSK